MNFAAPGDQARAYGMRGNQAANAGNGYRIEGEYVTVAQIAERVGVTRHAINRRLAELRNASGAITWARLAA